jgi:hypothetical protein
VLGEFLKQNPERFRDEAQLSLRQVYLNPDLRPDLENDARQLLSQLNGGDEWEAIGDRTLAPRRYEWVPRREVARDFGDEFAREIASLPAGDWRGPIYSPFGAHLVRVDARADARLPALAEIRDEVLREYLADKREQQRELAYEELRGGYDIIVESLDTEATGVLSQAVAGVAR